MQINTLKTTLIGNFQQIIIVITSKIILNLYSMKYMLFLTRLTRKLNHMHFPFLLQHQDHNPPSQLLLLKEELIALILIFKEEAKIMMRRKDRLISIFLIILIYSRIGIKLIFQLISMEESVMNRNNNQGQFKEANPSLLIFQIRKLQGQIPSIVSLSPF